MKRSIKLSYWLKQAMGLSKVFSAVYLSYVLGLSLASAQAPHAETALEKPVIELASIPADGSAATPEDLVLGFEIDHLDSPETADLDASEKPRSAAERFWKVLKSKNNNESMDTTLLKHLDGLSPQEIERFFRVQQKFHLSAHRVFEFLHLPKSWSSSALAGVNQQLFLGAQSIGRSRGSSLRVQLSLKVGFGFSEKIRNYLLKKSKLAWIIPQKQNLVFTSAVGFGLVSATNEQGRRQIWLELFGSRARSHKITTVALSLSANSHLRVGFNSDAERKRVETLSMDESVKGVIGVITETKLSQNRPYSWTYAASTPLSLGIPFSEKVTAFEQSGKEFSVLLVGTEDFVSLRNLLRNFAQSLKLGALYKSIAPSCRTIF